MNLGKLMLVGVDGKHRWWQSFLSLLIFNDEKHFFKFSNLRSLELSLCLSPCYVFLAQIMILLEMEMEKVNIMFSSSAWIQQFTQSKHKFCYLFCFAWREAGRGIHLAAAVDGDEKRILFVDILSGCTTATSMWTEVNWKKLHELW